jgi:hypothetical protein
MQLKFLLRLHVTSIGDGERLGSRIDKAIERIDRVKTEELFGLWIYLRSYGSFKRCPRGARSNINPASQLKPFMYDGHSV